MAEQEKQPSGIGDVNGTTIGSGARYNTGKTRYDLIPTHLLKSTADVFEYGAHKYASWNWGRGMKFSVLIGCIKRHLAAIEVGEDIDPESGKRHVGHLMCNLLMLEHYMNMVAQYPQLKSMLDDRPDMFTAAGAARLLPKTGDTTPTFLAEKTKEQGE